MLKYLKLKNYLLVLRFYITIYIQYFQGYLKRISEIYGV